MTQTIDTEFLLRFNRLKFLVLTGKRKQPQKSLTMFYTNVNYAQEILMATNNGQVLSPDHRKLVFNAEKDDLLQPSEIYDLKTIHERVFLGFYNSEEKIK